MEIKVLKNKIEIENLATFNIKKCLECGQIFRYEIIDQNNFIVYETNEKIKITQNDKKITIFTKDPKKHINYFDLETDYDKINARISKISPTISKAVNFGKGIRILKQDFLEMLISFIISANNNIPRIKHSLFKLCENYGEKNNDFYAFPTLNKLRTISLKQWQDLGVGYRAKSLVKVCEQLKQITVKDIEKSSTKDARKMLISLAGVGPKVADCVLLFALGKKDVFPTDTWIKKVFTQNFAGEETSAKKISEYLSQKYNQDSGIIQQYLFYYKREKGDKNE